MGLRRRRRSSATSIDGLLEIDKNGLKPVKIIYAKKKKPESRLTISLQVAALVFCCTLIYYVYYHFDHFHFNLVHFYATKMDDPHAQHSLAHKLLKKGSNITGAFHWFRKSADKGHAESAYNLAAGHFSGYPTDLEKGEAKQLLEFAARNDVREAIQLLQELCVERPEYCKH